MDRNYKSDVKIDDTILDVECLELPEAFSDYAEHLAHCNDVLRRAEEKVKTIRSEIILAESGTGQILEATYRTDKDYKKAKEECSAAALEAEMALVAVQSMRMKRDELSNLVTLHGQQYFAGPSTPHDKDYIKNARAKKVAGNTADTKRRSAKSGRRKTRK